jgi:hypothetical protein
MTVLSARKILETPRFGDAQCIEAVGLLEALEYAKSLNGGQLSEVECSFCSGTGKHYCYDCNRPHDCGCCAGQGSFSKREDDSTLSDIRLLIAQLEAAA